MDEELAFYQRFGMLVGDLTDLQMRVDDIVGEVTNIKARYSFGEGVETPAETERLAALEAEMREIGERFARILAASLLPPR